MKKIIIWSVSGIIAAVVVLLLVIYLLPGYDISVVRSDSMKPVFAAGDMLITVPPGSFLGGEIKSGSIVAFETGDETTTHRVVSVDQGTLITKGDANEEADTRPVELSQVKGIYLFRIPRIGYLNAFIHTRMGWLLVFVLPGALLVGLIAKDIIKEALRDDKKAKVAASEDKPLKPSSHTEDRQGMA